MLRVISNSPMYDQDAVQPMRDELLAVGFEELLSAQEVDNALKTVDEKITLVFINSVCGCAAGSARPGISLALQNGKIPDRLYTVFAGQEKDAVQRLRAEYIKNFPPSSPSIAIFKQGQLLFFMQRLDIEGYGPEQISNELCQVFDELCTKEGPSVSAEQFAQIEYAKQCGSKIPLFKQEN